MLSQVFAFAHGDLDIRIAEVTAEIRENPDSSFLYVKRAKLHFQHETYRKSLRDLRRSKKLRYSSAEQMLLFAKNYNRLGKFEKSMTFIDDVLQNDMHHVLAIKLKAKVLYTQMKFHESALAFEDVINYSSKTFPENYIEASLSWEALNDQEGNTRALLILNKGIEEFGDLIIFYNRLLEFSLAQKDYNSAINAQSKIVDISPRKERPYFELSLLYQQDGNYQKAIECINKAKDHYNKLSPRLKNNPSMKDLIKSINSKRDELRLLISEG